MKAKRAKCAAAVPELTDAQRLDHLGTAGGFLRGTADGAIAYRILGSDVWLADLREAIDAHAMAAKQS
jgi:hypothetical protein